MGGRGPPRGREPSGDPRPGPRPARTPPPPAPRRPRVQLWLLPAARLPTSGRPRAHFLSPGRREGGKNNPPPPPAAGALGGDSGPKEGEAEPPPGRDPPSSPEAASYSSRRLWRRGARGGTDPRLREGPGESAALGSKAPSAGPQKPRESERPIPPTAEEGGACANQHAWGPVRGHSPSIQTTFPSSPSPPKKHLSGPGSPSIKWDGSVPSKCICSLLLSNYFPPSLGGDS